MYRAEAARPVERTRTILAERGRILARDGTVLACDRPVLSLAMQYRWLEEPPDPVWLRHTARSHLTAAERRNSERSAAEESRILALREALHRRLAGLCGVSLEPMARPLPDDSIPRASTVRSCESPRDCRSPRESRQSSLETSSAGLVARVRGPQIVEWPDPQFHAASPDDFRGRAIAGSSTCSTACRWMPSRRSRPSPSNFPACGSCAIVADRIPTARWRRHLLGFVSATADAEHEEEQLADGTGRAGVERQYDAILRGAAGREVDTLDHHGQTITSRIVRGATAGRDLRF